METQKTVVALPTTGSALRTLKHWLGSGLQNEGPLSFVHVMRKQVSPSEFSILETPSPAEFRKFREEFIAKMRGELLPLMPANRRETASFEVLLAETPEDALCDYLKEEKAQRLVVATRGLTGIHGFFSSSFTTKMARHAPCDLLVLRPRA